jgi:hypothetical protein
MPPSKGAEVSTPSGGIVYCFFEFHLIIALSASASIVITYRLTSENVIRTWALLLLSFDVYV